MFKKYRCKSFKPKYDYYPPSVYNNITDDPDTWGMCCSKEMAYKCAEEYYDRYMRHIDKHKHRDEMIKKIGLVFFIVSPLLLVVLFLLNMKYS